MILYFVYEIDLIRMQNVLYEMQCLTLQILQNSIRNIKGPATILSGLANSNKKLYKTDRS